MTPFCDARVCPHIAVVRDDWERPIMRPFAVECHRCDESGPSAETEDEAVQLHELKIRTTGGTGETR